MNETYAEKAKRLVREYVGKHLDKSDKAPVFDVYVVWFAYTLGHWKALLSTTLYDGMYYEVTYNVTKKETYFDAYKKFENVCIPDGFEMYQPVDPSPTATIQVPRPFVDPEPTGTFKRPVPEHEKVYLKADGTPA